MSNKVELNPAVQEQVNRMIGDGFSDRAIVTALESIGVKISQPTINRYRNSEDLTVENKNAKHPVSIPDDVVIKTDLGIDTGKVLTEFKTRKHAGIARERMLETIVNNQLAIVIAEQRRFIAGESKYPFESVRALKELLTLFDSTRLKVTSQKEIDSILQDEKVKTLIEKYRAQGYLDGQLYFNSSGNTANVNEFEIDELELAALTLPAQKQRKAITDIKAAYTKAFKDSMPPDYE